MAIRSAQAQDVARMATLLLDGFKLVPLKFQMFSGIVHAGLQADIHYRMAKPSLYQAFVAVNAIEQVVGTVEVQIQQSNSWLGLTGRYGYLSNLTVDSRYRRSGLAAALLQACAQQVIAWDEEQLLLHVMAENTSARRLYLRSGYQIQSRTQGLFFFTGKRNERLLLNRSLKGANLASGEILDGLRPSNHHPAIGGGTFEGVR